MLEDVEKKERVIIRSLVVVVLEVFLMAKLRFESCLWFCFVIFGFVSSSLVVCLFVFLSAILGTEPTELHILGMCPTAELYSQLLGFLDKSVMM